MKIYRMLYILSVISAVLSAMVIIGAVADLFSGKEGGVLVTAGVLAVFTLILAGSIGSCILLIRKKVDLAEKLLQASILQTLQQSGGLMNVADLAEKLSISEEESLAGLKKLEARGSVEVRSMEDGGPCYTAIVNSSIKA